MGAVPGRRAGQHEVARAELGHRGDVGEDLRQVEQHVGARFVLPGDAVVLQRDPQFLRVPGEGRGDQERAGGEEGGGVLGREPVGADRLQVAPVDQRPGGDVVADRVAGHVLERVLRGQVAGGPPDHRGQLELPVVVGAALGEDDLVVGAGQRARQAGEHVRAPGGGPLVHHRLGPGAHLLLRDVGVVAGHRLVGAALGHHDVDHVRPVVGAALQDLPGSDRAADVQVGEVGPVGCVVGVVVFR